MRASWKTIGNLCAALFLGSVVTVAASAAQPADLRELELEMREKNLELAGRIAALEDSYRSIWGAGVLSLAGVLGVYVWTVRKAKRAMDTQLEEMLVSRPGALLKLIEEHDAEERLRRETPVTIISRSLELESVLRQHGFREVVTVEDGALDAALERAKAVVIDLEDGVEEARAAEIIAAFHLEQVLVFSIDPVRKGLPRGKVIFANSPMTLFSRLQELLKFKAAEARG